MLPNVLNAKKAAIISPTYSEHANVWRKHRVEIVELDLGEDVPDDVQVLVITNPNNPDARLIEVKQLLAFAEKMKMRKGWLIVDEAFCDSMPDQSLVPYLSDNVIVLRSIGKFFGLAGLRLGFAIASPKIGKILETLMGPWAVSGPALETGRRALLDTDWISQTRDALFLQSKELAQVLTQCGFGIEGVNPLFVYVRHEKAVRVHEALAKRHILVRYFLERPEFLRFGLCANKGQLGRFKMVLDEVMTNV